MWTLTAARATLAVALCLVGPAGCTTAADPPSQDVVRAERYTLEGTVQYIQTWSRQHLYDDLSLGHQTDTIPDEAWQRALRRAADGAAAVHLGCASAKVTVAKANKVDIRLSKCAYPVGGAAASPNVETLATAEGCLVLAVPTGPVNAFLHDQVAGGGFAPPTFVESAADAAPGTWYVGPCD